MCGRFTLRTPTPVLLEQFQLETLPPLTPRFNIAPTQQVLAVRHQGEAREGVWLKWGLVPSWSKDAAGGSRLINARSDTVAQKPSFRSAFRQRRCLVLADGYYEWKAGPAPKQPFFIHRRDDQPFALAGLWERWNSPEGPLETCCLLTTEANDCTRAIHDRMPVILTRLGGEQWLETAAEDAASLQALLRPFPAEELVAEPVNRYVNNPRHEGPECLAAGSP